MSINHVVPCPAPATTPCEDLLPSAPGAGGRPELSVVVPFYNEQENAVEVHRRLTLALKAIGCDYELVFVDDGSRDRTPALLDAIQASDPHVVVLHLSRNFGHQPAISAGLGQARGRGVVLMDGDLQ